MMKEFARIGILAAATLATLISTAAPAEEGKVFSFQDAAGDHLDILYGGTPVGRYMYAHDTSTSARRIETYKPYLHIFDPEGKAPITKGPGGEYTHHRGIFIGWVKIGVGGKSYDRWHMKGGEQVHQAFSAQQADAAQAAFTSNVDWNDEKGKPLLQEQRTMTFRNPPAGAYVLVDFVSVLKALDNEVTLGGDPEHSGVQFRPANEVDRKLTTYLFPKEKANTRTDRDYPWVGETYTLAERKFSVVEMSHPENPKGTRWSAYRNYGRFGAFPTATIPAGQSLTLRYRFLVTQGDMLPVEKIQDNYNQWAGASSPTPQTTVRPADQPAPNKTPAKKPAAKVLPEDQTAEPKP